MPRVLITGLSGFVGHHVAEGVLKNTDWEVVGLDRYHHSGTMSRIMDIDTWEENKRRVKLIWHDLRSPINPMLAREIGRVDSIFHIAASSHVDRSIDDPMAFVMDNVVGTCNLLNYGRSLDGLEKLFYFSTDEVFGPAPENVAYKEWDRYNSGNPYSASKAGGEELALAFHNTYKLPVLVTHGMNIFGERQHPEKFIPLCIRRCLTGERVLIHSNPARTQAGSRFYIHARNVAAAMLFLCEHGQAGDKYNIVGEKEVSNLDLALLIESFVQDIEPAARLDWEMVDFHSSRPGHDLRYALDGTKLRKMGFDFPKTFEESLRKVVHWSLENRKWLLLDEPAVAGASDRAR
jgi:dTDP-glucose 4,6-dehydratase